MDFSTKILCDKLLKNVLQQIIVKLEPLFLLNAMLLAIKKVA